MLNNLTYKKKNQLLIIGSVLLMYVIYSFGIKGTLKAYRDHTEMQDQLLVAENAPSMVNELENEIFKINSKIGKQELNSSKDEHALLDIVTNYCQNNDLVLREFPKSKETIQNNIIVETNQFVIQGSFVGLLRFVYLLEQKNKIGKTASVRYQLKKDMQTKEMILMATIYLQRIKQN